MHDNDDLAEPDLDTLTRAELAELDGPAATVAGILDEWLHRLHGITSGQHGAGLFLDLLAAEGWRVERIQVPPVFATPAGPATVRYWPAAPTPEQATAAKQAALETALALYDEQQPPPGRVPTVTVGQDFTPEHRYVLRAYRQAHASPPSAPGYRQRSRSTGP